MQMNCLQSRHPGLSIGMQYVGFSDWEILLRTESTRELGGFLCVFSCPSLDLQI